MLYKISRGMQLIGLILLPFAISGNAADKLDLRQSLILSGVGVGIFFLGYLLQQSTRPE